jgi:hypothetical protein
MESQPPVPKPSSTTESATQYEPLSPEEQDRVLKDLKKWLTDHRTAPRQKKMSPSDARLPKN